MLDVLIIGAGISGISAACHLRQKCPSKTFAILEGRKALGGTWDLFRYPGIRSDSDMHTFGFNFKPWTNPKSLADGPSILKYLNEAVAEHQLEDQIRYSHRVEKASWSESESCWTVITNNEKGEKESISSRVLFMCSGYYNYDRGYLPDFTGLDDFEGITVHPQHWPEDLDYRNKKVVVIGSGATAMTIVPAMAGKAEKVTMLQRSPTYVASAPGEDRIANFLGKVLPANWAYAITRWRNIRFQNYVYKQSRKNPEKLKNMILKRVRKELNTDFDVDRHFTPSYNPWDERLCLVPDADLFKAINRGDAEVVTAEIECITANGVKLTNGDFLEADMLVTATGLNLQMMGGVEFDSDGEAIDFSQRFYYQGMMFSSVPNLLQTFGYINASWTLRADLNSEFLCRVLDHMDAKGASRFVPVLNEKDENMETKDWVSDFQPGYMKRAMHLFPKQGADAPWHNTQNYLLDRKLLGSGDLEDGVLQFR
ncbi:MAG: NAD(P)/FAD-dependent oxidoreductase [Gammaproteobacteria bacterium]|jgi:cation diffusion facilitator CzcD-associated flavoprotein CzcO|nr:NAD(P)/FAD-dependent oxidoreductase [Gammaproteobacteria bacterium]MBT3858536.1 NAD(P)/FAD-dependent oxidoreductase [Gammaproteobacteria bacterium]MBT3986726.1 NAD(P)/FAD-dependent oxidoreductase [Gammaproteobacteria bacterium]MBT4255638.1 NAD(P)/FAD-dependent oxidoreductase [Gammaproteobacteria bacterium]MBT4582822.1 NAD(P)/FAD-dependent oxidoreductase [Gammaproteobacteria bacterium]